MFLLEFIGDALASAFGSAFSWRRKPRVAKESWSARRSRRRMERWNSNNG